MIRTTIERLGARATHLVLELGRIGRFFGILWLQAVKPPFRLRRLVREIYDSGVLSLALICASGLVVGLVLGLQLYNVLVRFGAEETLGTVVGLTLIRELGPVLTALLVTGRAGSAMAAEIGVMTATEQIDGMRTLAVDPMHYVVAPKALALTLSLPLLSCLFIVFAIFGAYLIGVVLLGLDAGVYMSGLEQNVEFDTDVLGSLLKALVFGALISLIATYRGYHSGRSAEAVGRSTTSTVVTASIWILIANYIVTSLWEF
jgi:phospholipid/cholesterol/gamma-HCH transport system permease protein